MRIYLYCTSYILFICIVFFNSQKVAAQVPEIRIVVNSGLFSFKGAGAESNSFITEKNQTKGVGYTNNPYGAKVDISYGLSGNLKFVTPSNFIFGGDLGFEVLRSKVGINSVSTAGEAASISLVADGKTNLNQNFINLFPFMGYQLRGKAISTDLIFGLDLAYCTGAKEKGEAIGSNGTIYTSSLDRKTIDFDYRPRAQVGINYQKFGLYAGYSLGLANYKAKILGSTNNDARASYIRFGISCKVN